MDADDISKPTRIEKQMRLINADNKDIIGAVGTWGEHINYKGDVIGKIKTGPICIEEHDKLYSQNEAILLIDPSSIINRKTFWECKGYREDYFPPCDLDFWYRFSEKEKKIIAIPEFLFQYRIHSNSFSVQKASFQRTMTHFVNFNMRLRRADKSEIVYEEFKKNIWSKFSYRCPRIINDKALIFYKKAGFNYGNGKYLKFIFYLLLVLCINPKVIYKKLLFQNFAPIKVKI